MIFLKSFCANLPFTTQTVKISVVMKWVGLEHSEFVISQVVPILAVFFVVIRNAKIGVFWAAEGLGCAR